MTAPDIRALLSHPSGYRQPVWRDFLKAVFPAAEIFATPAPITQPGEDLPPGSQLGRVLLADGRRIAFIEQPVPPGVDLARNRVGLRSRILRLLNAESATGVLAVFTREGDPNFRLSFVARESAFAATEEGVALTTTETAPRRFTYYLGPAESCTTAAQRFEQLASHGAAAELSHLIEAFSVEKLNAEFFRDFSRAVSQVAASLGQTHADWPEDLCRTEAQTLLNRLVFLYFVQRKGWLHRSRTFLTDAFRPHADKPGATFFREFLAPLFEALSTEPAAAPAFAYDVPFLNGGLFSDEAGADDPDIQRRRSLDLPNTVFRSVFDDLLDRYNFTIVEDSPSSFEVAIDPEMLGRVFEALVLQREESDTGGKSRRHDTGSHYTPRPIVHYLCREALAGWLADQPPFTGQPDARRKIDTLLALDASEGIDDATRCVLDSVLTSEEAESLSRRLLTLRMCDPAVGSGAFPLGFLHELLNLLRLCEARSRGQDPGDPAWLYESKKQIIEQVIYGVDLQSPATELCKLRLWLSLMVDHELKADPFRCSQSAFQKALRQLEPLPNLDFKIRAANSLIDLIHGQRVRFDGSDPVNESIPWIVQLADAKHAFFSARKLTDKRRLRLAIYEAYAALGEIALRIERNKVAGLGLDNSDAELAQIAGLDTARKELAWIAAQVKSARKEKAATQDRLIESIRLRLSDPALPTFVWKLDFAEVFFEPGDPSAAVSGELPLAVDGELPLTARRLRLRGFDLHLGNPPYIRIQTLKKTDPELADYYKTRFHSASRGNYDLYVCFVERGMELLHPRGQLAYILPHKFFNNEYGSNLRSMLARRRALRHIVHFGVHQIFPGATNYVCLLFLSADSTPALRFSRVSDYQRWLRDFSAEQQAVDNTTLSGDEWNFGGVADDALLEKLRKQGKRLLDLPAQMSRGSSSGDDDIFMLPKESSEVEEELLRIPVFAKDFGKYRFVANNEWRIVYPYRRTAKGVTLIPEDELRSAFPKAHAYLSRNATKLKQRKGARHWYGYSAARNLDLHDTAHILVPLLAARASFALIPPQFAGKLCPMASGGFTVSIPGEAGMNVKYVLGVINSPPAFWILLKTSNAFHGGWITCTKQYFGELPIPAATPEQEAEIVRLVEWLLWLHRQESVRTGEGAGAARDPLLAAYLEQWVNALVYELFLPAELHAAGLHFFSLTATLRLPPVDTHPEPDRLPALRRLFTPLYDENGPLRAALFTLGTLEEVRLIEGQKS